MNEWDFLDRMDFNLLYRYADIISSKENKQLHSTINNLKDYSDDIREYEIEKLKITKERKRRAYYLIWFVYRYVLNCETYEDAKLYMNKETLQKYKIESYVRNYIYIGADEDTAILPNGLIIELKKVKLYVLSDIEIILDILYNRYDFFSQFECFISHTDKARRSNAVKIFKQYKELRRILI